MTEGSRITEKDRETLKGKIAELEVKNKELEARRSTMIFEFEKERAMWTVEKDHINSQKIEMQEHVERL